MLGLKTLFKNITFWPHSHAVTAMLPEFPKFKPIELSDKEAVEKITSKYPPYSDFNFVSMWSWDIKGQMRISALHGNLVVLFTDYLTSLPFYSFLGNNKVNETVEELLQMSKNEGLKPELKLVPEDSIKGLDGGRFHIAEDRDNFDYIYEVESLMEMSSDKFGKKGQHSRFFKKNFMHEIKVLDLKSPLVKNELINLFNDWAADKDRTSTDYFKNEFSALSRFLNYSESINFFAIGIYLEEKLISASITENTHSIYNLGHFQKSLTSSFKGLNDYLMNELAKMLNERKITYMNCEQDLGLLGLRESKESYLPSHYLKKFSLSTNEQYRHSAILNNKL